MTKLLFLPLLIALTVTMITPSKAAHAAGVGHIVYTYGPAWVQRGSSREELSKGDIVFRYDSIITGERGRVKIIMGDGSKVYVGAQSRISLRKYSLKNKRLLGATISMLWGKARFFVKKLTSRNTAFRVQTSTAVLGVRGTEFVVVVVPTPELLENSFGKYTVESLPAIPTRIVLVEGAVDVGSFRSPNAAISKLTPGNTANISATGKIELRPTKGDDIQPDKAFSPEEKQQNETKKRLEMLPLIGANNPSLPETNPKDKKDEPSKSKEPKAQLPTPTVEVPVPDVTDTNNAIQNLSNTSDIQIRSRFVKP